MFRPEKKIQPDRILTLPTQLVHKFITVHLHWTSMNDKKCITYCTVFVAASFGPDKQAVLRSRSRRGSHIIWRNRSWGRITHGSDACWWITKMAVSEEFVIFRFWLYALNVLYCTVIAIKIVSKKWMIRSPQTVKRILVIQYKHHVAYNLLINQLKCFKFWQLFYIFSPFSPTN
jgi:hypothetical protein